ncbi:MAG: hypothetical protein HXX18_09500 [Bacteroidetes bacterium]|nr:hypothetical protein [Bacteroidota bacterium]
MADSILDKRKTDFLLRHPELAVNHICRYYPFSFEELKEYDNELLWWKIDLNHYIPWSYEIIDYFIDKFDFNGKNEYYGPGFFCLNYGLPWSIEFIKRYETLWDWNILMYNLKLRRNPEIYEYMQQTYLKYTTPKDVKQANKIKSFGGSDYDLRENYPEIDNFIFTSESLWHGKPYTTWEEVENDTPIDWDEISKNSFLPWSIEIIDKYKYSLNFRNLCWNHGVPWSTELIFKFFVRFQESAILGCDEDTTNKNQFLGILNHNPCFPWNMKNIRELEDYIPFDELSFNYYAEWSIDLLEYYEDKWDYPNMVSNQGIIPKAFPELSQFEVMKELWLEILKRKRNAKQKL